MNSRPDASIAVIPREAGATLPAAERRVWELAQRAATGDLNSTQEFLAEVWVTLVHVAGAVLGGRHPDLQDTVQQSAIALVRALPAFRGECHPAGYASRIALRVALRARKNTKRDAGRRETLSVLDRGEILTDGNANALAARRRQLLCGLLQALPPEQAEALTLRVVMGFSLDEVARASGAPINTVRSRVRLAKEALRARIEGGPAFDDLSLGASL